MRDKYRMIEINGNLDEEKDFNIFYETISKVLEIFIGTFGNEVMNKYDLFIDNATQSSGDTPITTVLLKNSITIKLGIEDFSNKEQIAYQFSHELCHCIFYSLKGLNKEKASGTEENICSAMSLIILNLMYPNEITKWINYVNSLKNESYNKGAIIANECNFNINTLKSKIYEICETTYNK